MSLARHSLCLVCTCKDFFASSLGFQYFVDYCNGFRGRAIFISVVIDESYELITRGRTVVIFVWNSGSWVTIEWGNGKL